MVSNILCRNVHTGTKQLLIPGPIVSDCFLSPSIPSSVPVPVPGREVGILSLESLMCFCCFSRYRGIVPVFTQSVGSTLESRTCRHAASFYALVSSYFPQIYLGILSFPYRNVVARNGKLSVPFHFCNKKVFLTLAIKISVFKICILQLRVFSFFCKRLTTEILHN